MPTIRDVVEALGERAGVDSVVVLGRDGLPIVSVTPNGGDPDSLAALVTPLVDACSQVGHAGDCGDFSMSVVEYERGLIIVCVLTPETLLAISVQPNTNIGPLLYELQQNRSSIAGLL